MYSIFKLLNLLQLKRLVRQKDSSCLPPPCDSAAPASEASSTRASSHILQSRSRDHLHQSRSTFPSPVDAPRAAASPTARTPVEAPRAGARSRGPRWTRPAPPAHSEPAVRARPARTPVNARPRGPRWTPPAASPLPERQRRCPLARAHQRPDAPISGGQAPAPRPRRSPVAVFAKLDVAEIQLGAGLVCRAWHRLAASDPTLWRRVDMTYQGTSCRPRRSRPWRAPPSTAPRAPWRLRGRDLRQ